MDTPQIITASIAGLSLVISIISLWTTIYFKRREIEKEKRTISIAIQPINWTDVVQLIITSTGHRPITIKSVSLAFKKKLKRGFVADVIPAGLIFESFTDPGFPTTLEDGKTLTLNFSEIVRKALETNNMDVALAVYDSEGHAYSHYEVKVFNAKYESYTAVPELWKRHKIFLGITLPIRVFGERK